MSVRARGNHASMGYDRASDRRASCAEALARGLLVANGPLTFDDLAARCADASVRDVAAWLGHAVESGLVDELGGERLGPRRFRLRPNGADVLTSARRERDGKLAA